MSSLVTNEDSLKTSLEKKIIFMSKRPRRVRLSRGDVTFWNKNVPKTQNIITTKKKNKHELIRRILKLKRNWANVNSRRETSQDFRRWISPVQCNKNIPKYTSLSDKNVGRIFDKLEYQLSKIRNFRFTGFISPQLLVNKSREMENEHKKDTVTRLREKLGLWVKDNWSIPLL